MIRVSPVTRDVLILSLPYSHVVHTFPVTAVGADLWLSLFTRFHSGVIQLKGKVQGRNGNKLYRNYVLNLK